MTLPELPKQLKKRESALGLKLRQWVENATGSCVFELKQTTEPSILFDCVGPQQIAHLMSAKSHEGILMKNQDKNGFPDYSYHRHSPAWVVIRYPRSFYVIDIEAFLMEKKRSKRKSLTSKRADQISTWSVALYKR